MQQQKFLVPYISACQNSFDDKVYPPGKYTKKNGKKLLKGVAEYLEEKQFKKEHNIIDKNIFTGFEAYYYIDTKETNIIIAYTAANSLIDKLAGLRLLNGLRTKQLEEAVNFLIAVQKAYPNCEITVTGSSLGGGLAMGVGAITGCKAVTFNTVPVRKLLEKMGIDLNKSTANIENYVSPDEAIFLSQGSRVDNYVGKTYIIEPDKKLDPYSAHANLSQFQDSSYVEYNKWEKTHKKRNLGDWAREQKDKLLNGEKSVNAVNKETDNKTMPNSTYANESKNRTTPAGNSSNPANTSNNTQNTKNISRYIGARISAQEIDDDKWDDNDIAFLEGFHSKDRNNYLIKEAKERRKQRAKQNGNRGRGPNGENGYWYTTKTGKHVFVADDKAS